MVFFFFSSRRRHTRCGRDWSSDVCSSDLVPFPAALDGNRNVDRGACHICSVRRRACGESWSESLQFACHRAGGGSDFGRSLRGHWTPLDADRIACRMELCRGCTVWNVGLRWTGERGAQPWNSPRIHNFDRRRVWTGGVDRGGAVVLGGRCDSPVAYGAPGTGGASHVEAWSGDRDDHGYWDLLEEMCVEDTTTSHS